jgi:hypothetical protein
MSDTSRPSSSNWSLGTVLSLLLAVVVFPIILVVSPRTARMFLQREAWLDETSSKWLFAPDAVQPTTTRLAPKAIGERLERLVEEKDWLAIGRVIADWEASREMSSVGTPVHEIALTMLRWHLAEQIYPPNMCNFDAYFMIPNAAISELERIVSINPGNHVLTAILAQCHIDRGWVARGGGWSEEVTKEGWQALQRSFHTAHGLLSRFDARRLKSPLLASVAFQLVVAIEDGREETRNAYDLWAELEPNSEKAHAHYAFMLLPRWFGDLATLDREARNASRLTEDRTGAMAYAAMYLTAVQYEDDAFQRIDIDLFRQGLHDILARDENPAMRAFELAAKLDKASDTGMVAIWNEILKRTIYRNMTATKVIARELLERYVTHRPFDAGSDRETKFLELLSRLWHKELAAGDGLRVGAKGIVVVPKDKVSNA